MTRPRLSVVTTLFQSASCVGEFYRRASDAAAKLTSDFEIIFVDDGSTDQSVEVARAIGLNDPRVRIFALSRNFGHHKAMMTGLSQARGESVFLVDSDLEIAPEVLLAFDQQMKASGADVVYGVQDVRRDGLTDRIGGWLFYTLFNWLSPYQLPRNLTTARLMSRRYVDSLLEHREQQTVIAGLWAITGYPQVPMVVEKNRSRPTTYDLGRKVVLLANAITSFSDRPLVLIFWTGLVISFLAAALAIGLVARRVIFGTVATGWLSLVVSIWLVGGLVIFCLGVLGIYLSRIFIETKRRPYTVIKDVYERTLEDS